MDLKKLIKEYLSQAKMMQVATVNNDQPWICTVYFVADRNLNIYWISTPARRHSEEIKNHSKVAAAIPIKYVPGEKVVGLQVEGEASLIEDAEEIKSAMRLYTDTYNRGEDWYKDFLAGKNNHKVYKLKPRAFVIFDEESFPGDPRQEFNL